MPADDDGARAIARQKRIWAISRILGILDADRYCVRKGDVVRIIRGAGQHDRATCERFIAALDGEFPGPDDTPTPVVYLAMLMNETGGAHPGRTSEIIQDAVRNAIDRLETVKVPGIERQ